MNYKNSKIYKIEAENEIYIGSTTSSLEKRFRYHTYQNNACVSRILFEKYGKENCKIVLLEEYPCSNRSELSKKEIEYIQKNECINRMGKFDGTKKEYNEKYYIENKERLQEYRKQRYDQDKDTQIEYSTKFYSDNIDKLKEIKTCECGGKYTYGHRKRHLISNKHKIFLSIK